MPARIRPLSPHLQIYRWQIGNSLSILHRLTGIALALGLIALSFWLISLAGGEESYRAAARVFASPIGVLLLIGWTFAFFYHLLNGVRHLFWDLGVGYERTAATPQRMVRRARGARLDAVGLARAVAFRAHMSLRSPLGRVLGTGSARARQRAVVGSTGQCGCADSAHLVVFLLVAGAAGAGLRRGTYMARAAAQRFSRRASGRRAHLPLLSRHHRGRRRLGARHCHEARLCCCCCALCTSWSAARAYTRSCRSRSEITTP